MLNKETITISIKLFLITAIAALCLAVVNKITAPIIAENNTQLEITSKQEVLSCAKEFISSEIPKLEADAVVINSINIGLDKKDGNVCGYVVVLTSSAGYGGDIKVMVGIDNELKVTRVKIMESAETAGLGANASKPKFIDQFIGKSQFLSVVKGDAKKNEISAIASATVTSNAVTDCVNVALEAARLKHESGQAQMTAQKIEEIKQETDKQILEIKEDLEK